MKLYLTTNGCVVEQESKFYSLANTSWDDLIAGDDLQEQLRDAIQQLTAAESFPPGELRAPIGKQEVWAAGVTYYRSRDARIQESKSSGGGEFYDRVYDAERPELFFKASAHRVSGPGGKVAIREDASWSVPEPELALLVSKTGRITGYTVGNDMSSRDIEGENPLYLPQAKVYDRSCALGPCILVAEHPLPAGTEIKLDILRGGHSEFSGVTSLSAMKRHPAQLVHYLFRNNSFPFGCFLLTGTGIVPPDTFTLQQGDEIRIGITGIGTIINFVG